MAQCKRHSWCTREDRHRGPCSKKPRAEKSQPFSAPPSADPATVVFDAGPIEDQVSLATQALAHLGVPHVRMNDGLAYLDPATGRGCTLRSGDGCVQRVGLVASPEDDGDRSFDGTVLQAILRRMGILNVAYGTDRQLYSIGERAITVTNDGRFVHPAEFSERPALTP